jgi:hypothetical protein
MSMNLGFEARHRLSKPKPCMRQHLCTSFNISLFRLIYLMYTHCRHIYPPIFHLSSKYSLFRKMKIPSIQPLHPIQPSNTTARSPVRNRRKPHKPSHSRQNNHSTNHPQHRLIMFLDGHHRTPGTLFPTCTGDNDARGHGSIEPAGEEELG